MMEALPSPRILLVSVSGTSRVEASFRELGWEAQECGAEDWFAWQAPEGPWAATVFDTTGIQGDTWLSLHRMVTRLPHPLVLAVDGPVPSSFHYPRPGGLRVSLMPIGAGPDVVRSIVSVAQQLFVQARLGTVAEAGPGALGWETERKVSVSQSIRQIHQHLEIVLDLLETPQTTEPQEFGTLGTREREVQALLFRGLNLADVADKLGISESTVKKHVHSIYQKRGVTSRAQFMALK